MVPFAKTSALYLSTANKFRTLTDSVILCLNMFGMGIKICQDFTTFDIKDSDKSDSERRTRRAMLDFSSQYVNTNSCIKRC